MLKKRILVFLSLILFFIGIRFWVGLYQHDEFGDKHIFIKHRPIWKWKFYSPIGMSDKQFDELAPKKQYEQRMFNEFIRGQGLSK